MKPCLILFANGLLPEIPAARRLIHPGDTIIAVDGGTQHALALGLMPSVIIGDLDSLTPADRQLVQRSDARLMEYPHDKNETDLELALHYAIGQGFSEIVIVGALGGRLDQTLANLSLLADPRLAALDVHLDDGVEAAFFTRRACRLHGSVGDIVSLIPWGGPVTGLVTVGLHWPLQAETLASYQTRGISNEMLAESADITIQSGILLVVHRRLHLEP